MRSGPSAAELAWLARSNIQIAEGPDAGGVRAWLDETPGPPGFIYSEITGYFITLCCQLAAQGERAWSSTSPKPTIAQSKNAMRPFSKLYGSAAARSGA